MSRIIFATGNQNKMREIREIMQGFQVDGENVEILSMKEAGVYAEIVEDGKTFAENASIKAKAIAALTPGDFVMADDSGLEIDVLNKVMLPIWHHPEKRKKESVSMFSDFSFYCIRCFAFCRYCWYSSQLSQMKHPF